MGLPASARAATFSLEKPIPSLEGYVGRRVLANLLHAASVSKDVAALHPAYNSLIARWRGAANALCSVEAVDFLRKRLFHFLNCDPAGINYSKSTASLYCDLPDLCPHCYARRAQRVFVGLRNYFSGIADAYRKYYFLYRYKTWRQFRGGDDSLRHAMRHTFERGREFFKSTGVDAGFNLVTAVPGSQNTWKVFARGFLIGGEGMGQSQLAAAFPRSDGRSLKAHQSPTAKEIAASVANALRYPVGVLNADKHRLAELINARRRMHLTAFYGTLRKPRRPPCQEVDPDDMAGVGLDEDLYQS